MLSVKGTGIFSLESQCEANTVDDDIKLIPKRKIISKLFKNYIPQLNLTLNFDMFENLSSKELNNSLFIKEDSKIKDNLNKLTDYSKSLNELRNHLENNNPEKTNMTFNYWLHIIVILIVNSTGLISFFIIYMKIKTVCRKKKEIKSNIDKEIELRNSPESPLPRII